MFRKITTMQTNPIMILTESSGNMEFIANTAHWSAVVFYDVYRLVTCKLEIFYTIITSNMIFMMHNFCVGKIAPKVFFHHKSMFSNITASIGERMSWVFNKYISVSSGDSTFPTRMITKFYGLCVTFCTKISCMCSTINRANCFSTKHAISFGHKSIVPCGGI